MLTGAQSLAAIKTRERSLAHARRRNERAQVAVATGDGDETRREPRGAERARQRRAASARQRAVADRMCAQIPKLMSSKSGHGVRTAPFALTNRAGQETRRRQSKQLETRDGGGSRQMRAHSLIISNICRSKHCGSKSQQSNIKEC